MKNFYSRAGCVNVRFVVYQFKYSRRCHICSFRLNKEITEPVCGCICDSSSDIFHAVDSLIIVAKLKDEKMLAGFSC